MGCIWDGVNCMSKKLFGIVAGTRTSGKTTLAGTLPGSTLLLQARGYESGSRSAEKLAARRGNQLTVNCFDSTHALVAMLGDAAAGKYDNIYVDGLSGITEMRWRDSDVIKAAAKDNWAGYRMVGDTATDVIMRCKALTEGKNPKNVFMSCALRKTENNDVELEVVGRMAVSAVTKFGEAVLSLILQPATEGGALKRTLVTRSYDVWPGRIDSLLDDENPGLIEPDLSLVLKLFNNEVKDVV